MSRDLPAPQTWGGGKIIRGLYRPLREFRPVLALTIIHVSNRRPEVLVGVRDPETNRTHQNVASVPTRRVRQSVARRWLWSMRSRRAMSASDRDDLRDEVAHMFSRKLGLAEAQERGLIDFEVAGVAAFQGISVIGERPDGQPLTENLTMFNAVVMLNRGSDVVPAGTASYRPIVWAHTDDFVAMTRMRDPGRLNAGLENALFCAYGLCLQTSVEMLSSLTMTAPSGGE